MRRLATASAGVLSLVLAAAAPPASARIFNVVQAAPDSWTVYDPSSVERIDGSPVRRVWTVRVMRNISSSTPPQPGYVRTLTDYDCERREFRWREFSAFSRAGDLLLKKTNPSYSWESADKAIDTLAAYQSICERGRGQGVVAADSIAKLVITLMGTWDPREPQVAAGVPASKSAPAKPPLASKPVASKPVASSPVASKPPVGKTAAPKAAAAVGPVSVADLWP